MKKPAAFKNLHSSHLIASVMVAVSVAVVGYALFMVNAAGPFAKLEAGSTAPVAPAVLVSDPDASQGRALQFGPEPETEPESPPPDPGNRIFYDGFESDSLDQWGYQACPGGVTIVDSPTRKGNGAAKFTVSDGDTNSRCDDVPTHNPRAQLVSDGMFGDGDEYYIAHSIYFPSDFPDDPNGWFQIAELYGPPFGGSPSMGIDVCGSSICFSRDESHGYDSIWESPRVTKGEWHDLVYHVKFSTDASEGFVEIWYDGVKQTMKNGEERVYYQTLRPGLNWNGTPNSFFLNQYRQAGQGLGTVTLYHDEAAVGTTYESVAP